VLLMQQFSNFQVVRNYLNSATLRTECMIEFEGGRISLDIPSKGIVKEEWSITPLSAMW